MAYRALVVLGLWGCTDGTEVMDETGGTPTPGGSVPLTVDCTQVNSGATVWLGIEDELVEFDSNGGAVADVTHPEGDPDAITVTGAMAMTALPWGLTVSWFADPTDPTGTYRCDLDSDRLLQSASITYNDGTAMVWGARDASPDSDCTIEVTSSGREIGDAVTGTVSGTLVGLNAPGRRAFCGGFDVEIVDTI